MTADDAAELAPAVVAYLRDHFDAAVEEVVDALRDEIPEYADLMADKGGGSRAAGGGAPGRHLAPRRARVGPRPLGVGVGRGRRARHAAGSAGLLPRSRLGRRTTGRVDRAASALRRLQAVSAPTDDPALRDALGRLSRLGRALVRAYQSGFVRGEAERFHEQAARTNRAREEFLRRVLEDHVTDGAAVLRRAQALGLPDFRPPFLVAVVCQRPPRPEASLYDETAAYMRQLPVRTLQSVPYEDDPDYPAFAVVLVPAWDDVHLREVRAVLGNAGRRLGLVAVYDVARRLEDVRRVFLGLRSSVPVMDPCASLLGTVAAVDALLPYLMVSHLTENRQAVLLDLTAERPARGATPAVNAEHLVTLRTALDALTPNRTEVSRRLDLTRDTVRSHLDTVEQATGLGVAENHLLFAASFVLRDLLASESVTPHTADAPLGD